jgi:hypothetical protein
MPVEQLPDTSPSKTHPTNEIISPVSAFLVRMERILKILSASLLPFPWTTSRGIAKFHGIDL